MPLRFRLPAIRLLFVQLFRLGVLVAIAWVVRSHAVRLRIGGDAPITVQEVGTVFPGAAALIPAAGSAPAKPVAVANIPLPRRWRPSRPSRQVLSGSRRRRLLGIRPTIRRGLHKERRNHFSE